MTTHADITGGDNHTPITYIFSDSSARTSSTDPNTGAGYVSSAIGKEAWQTDNDSFWMLKDVTPTWIEISSVGAVLSVNSGTYITVDNTDPENPIVNFTGGIDDVLSAEQALTASRTLVGGANSYTTTSTFMLNLHNINGSSGNKIELESDVGIDITSYSPTDNSTFNADAVNGIQIDSTVGYSLGDTVGGNLPAINSDSGDDVLSINPSDGAISRAKAESFRSLSGSGAPIDGTTTAWFIGQTYLDTVTDNEYYATSKSTNPDSSGTGSIFSQAFVNANTIYSSDGTADVSTTKRTVTIDSGSGNNSLLFDAVEGAALTNGQVEISNDLISAGIHNSTQGVGYDINVNDGLRIFDGIAGIGSFYHADYSVNGIAAKGDRWIPDKAYVDSQVVSETLYTNDGSIDAALADRTVTVSDALNFGLLFQASNQTNTNDTYLYQISDSIELAYEDGVGGAATISVEPSGVRISDNLSGVGAFYAGDYSSTFIDRSLVDKGYADSLVNNIFDPILFNDGSTQATAAGDLVGGRTDSQSFSTSFDSTVQDAFMVGQYWRADGFKWYQMGGSTEDVFEYDLSVAWDVSTAVLNQSFNVAVVAGSALNVWFKPDGLVMFAQTHVAIGEFTLSTPWDISTAVHLIDHVIGFIVDVVFDPSGLSFIKLSTTNVTKYDMSVAWDITTAVLDLTSFTPTEPTNNLSLSGLFVSPNGRILYITDSGAGAKLYEYILPIPWDLTSPEFDGSTDFGFSETLLQAPRISPMGDKLYYQGWTICREFDLGLSTNGKIISNAGSTVKSTVGTNNVAITATEFQSQVTSEQELLFTGDGVTFDVATNVFKINSSGGDTTPLLRSVDSGSDGVNFAVYAGDRSPQNNVQANGGDLYAAKGTENALFINKTSGLNDDGWVGLSDISEGVTEVRTLADLPTPISGVINMTSGLYIFKAPINFGTNRIDITNQSVQMYSDNSFVNSITYEGTGTFITSTATAALRVFYPGITFFLTGDDATFVDIIGSLGIQFSSVIFTHVNGGNMGSISGSDTGQLTSARFFMTRSVSRGWVTGFNVSDTDRSYADTLNIFSHVNASGGFVNVVDAKELFYIVNSEAELNNVNAALFNIDPSTESPFYLNNCVVNGVGEFFKVNGVTGTFTAVTDASFVPQAFVSVTDSGGIARFGISGPTVYVGQEVVNEFFVVNTNYNGTHIITATDGTSYFEVSSIAFGTTESGSFYSNSVTLTDTATTLVDGDTLLIDTDLATDYDGGAKVYNQLTNSFQINRSFTVTKTGTWNTSGLNQKSNHVFAITNPNLVDSNYIASGYVNNNTTATGAIVNNTFTDMVFGTVGSSIVQSSNAERWKLIDDVNGTFEYTGNEPFDGNAVLDITAVSTGGAQEFRFKFVHDTGSGFVDLTDPVEALVEIGSESSSTSKHIPLVANKGDQIKPQITRNAGASGVTTSYATITIS